MREGVNVGPLTFVEVKAGTTHVGDNRGGWIHASQRPRHEVRLPAFYILESPLSTNEVAALLGLEETGQNDVHEGVDAALLQRICAVVRPLVDEGLEVRPPSLAEWVHARESGRLAPQQGALEVLADAPFSNHRGAPMDLSLIHI